MRSDFRFLHAADLHIDSPLRGLDRYEGAPVEKIRGATRRALENLVQLAIEEQVDFVILAGDLYDGDWRDYNTGLFLHRQLQRLAEPGIEVYLTYGNHDAQSELTKSLRLPGHCHNFGAKRPKTHHPDGLAVAIHGRDYPRREVLEDLSAGYPAPELGRFNIGVLHTALTGREGHSNYAPCTVDGLVSRGYQYWALGHVHTAETVREDPWIVFPGNTQGRHARETGPKGCVLVQVQDGQVAQVESRTLDVVRWGVLDLDLAGVADEDALYDLVDGKLEEAAEATEGRMLALRLVLSGASEVHGLLAREGERIRPELRARANAVAGEGVWLEKIAFRTRAAIDVEALRRDDGPLGSLLCSFAALQQDSASLKELLDSFSALKKKLPPEIHGPDGGLDLSDPNTIRARLDEVEQLLIAELHRGGDD